MKNFWLILLVSLCLFKAVTSVMAAYDGDHARAAYNVGWACLLFLASREFVKY